MSKVVAIISLIISSFVSANANAESKSAEYFNSLTYTQAIEKAKEWYKNKEGVMVKVTPNNIIASFPDGTRSSIPIPANKFFISIAPWVNFSHPCTDHVPTGCTGEMINEDMHLFIKDLETGQIINSGKVNTGNDGFIDVWLSSNSSYDINIHYRNNSGKLMQAREQISTFKSDRTCITSMQLVKQINKF